MNFFTHTQGIKVLKFLLTLFGSDDGSSRLLGPLAACSDGTYSALLSFSQQQDLSNSRLLLFQFGVNGI